MLYLYFRNGDPDDKKDYPDYARKKDQIVQWMLNEIDVPSRLVTCDQLDAIKEENDFVMTFFGTTKNPEFTDVFLDFASDEEN